MAQPQPPRRGEMTAADRKDLAWLLRDYAEMLESFAVGVDGGGPVDQDTLARVERARAFANRLE